MFINFFKIAFRNFLKYKSYTFINIAGLAIGLTSCILILLYVNYELSYDSYFSETKNIYRVSVEGTIGDNVMQMAVTPPPMGHAMVREYPEVLNAVRLMPSSDMLLRPADNIFIENNFLWVDSTFFDLFDYKMIIGDPATVLDEHHTVVLTRKTAMKYYGRLDVVGEIIEFEDFTPYKISGICEDPPTNTHLKFDILASLSSLDFDNADEWLWNTFHTYILLRDDADPELLQSKFREMIIQNVGPQLEPIISKSLQQFYDEGGKYDYNLTPISDIHLHSQLDYEVEPNSNYAYIYIFTIIAIFLLLIATINFMNLSTARAIIRGREVGVKKVLGSNRKQLIFQFLIESVLLTTISMLIAVLLVYVALPYFNQIADKPLQFTPFSEWYGLPLIIATILIVGFLAGIYPAFSLSSFQPVKVLKTSFTSITSGATLRKVLVIFQFAISIFLITSTFIILDQLDYMQNTNLGWDKDHILVIKRAWAVENNEQAMKGELLSYSNIKTFSSSGTIPGRGFGSMVFNRKGAPRAEQHLLSVMTSKADLYKTFGIELLDGRYFSDHFSDDSAMVVINESAAKELGLENPVGDQIRIPGDKPEDDYFLTVIGLVKDFHFESMHHKIRPLLIFRHRDWPGFIELKISPNNVKETIAFVEQTWKNFVPDKPLEYFFMDDDFAKLYETEERTGTIFLAFSSLAIFIACLGLFGLAAFTTIQRRKEVGIRKSMGASISSIVILISKQFISLVLMANVIAIPLSWIFMKEWLSSFEYRIGININYFVIAAITALLIALLTISYQSIKAAIANPVNALKYE